MKEDKDAATTKKRHYTVYNKEYHPLLIESLLQNAMTAEQVAEKIGIDKDTFYAWKNKYPEVAEAIKRGKAPVDTRVVAALYRSAMGYTYEEVTREPKALSTKELKERAEMEDPPPPPLIVTKVVRKYVAPNIIAQIFWLKNRLPAEWKDRNDVSISGEVKYEIGLPPKPEELAKRVEGDTKIVEGAKIELIEEKKKPYTRPKIKQVELPKGAENASLGLEGEVELGSEDTKDDSEDQD